MKTKNRRMLFTLTLDGIERFSFHAADASDADRKAHNWFDRHGMRVPLRYTVREGPGRYGDIQDSWVA